MLGVPLPKILEKEPFPKYPEQSLLGQSLIPDWMLNIAVGFFFLFAGVSVYFYYSKQSHHNALFWGWLSGVLLVSIVALFIRNDLIKHEVEEK